MNIAWWARWKAPTPKCTIPAETAARSYLGVPTVGASPLRAASFNTAMFWPFSNG